MKIISKIKEFRHDLNMAYQIAIRGNDEFVKELYQLVEDFKPYKQEVRKDIQEKFSDFKQLMLYDSLDKSMGLSPIGVQKRDQLLKKYNAKSALVAMAGIAGEINKQYNINKFTDKAKRTDLNVHFLEYCAKNDLELKELKELQSKAKSLGANNLALVVENYHQMLVKEENTLRETIEKLKPRNENARGKDVGGQKAGFTDKYDDLSNLIQDLKKLYDGNGRIPVLINYKGLVKDYGNDPVKIAEGIKWADRNWAKEDASKLRELSQSAQSLRGDSKVKKPEEVKKRDSTIERGL